MTDDLRIKKSMKQKELSSLALLVKDERLNSEQREFVYLRIREINSQIANFHSRFARGK